MSIYFFDSSALVNRYMPEVGITWIRSLTLSAANHQIFIALTTLACGCTRHYHDGKLSLNILQAFRQLLMWHVQIQYQVIGLSSAIVLKALQLHEAHRLRAFDEIQLASALELQARLHVGGYQLTFIGSDNRLQTTASKEGLAVDNPNNYP